MGNGLLEPLGLEGKLRSCGGPDYPSKSIEVSAKPVVEQNLVEENGVNDIIC